jgi:hypothetical protein
MWLSLGSKILARGQMLSMKGNYSFVDLNAKGKIRHWKI